MNDTPGTAAFRPRAMMLAVVLAICGSTAHAQSLKTCDALSFERVRDGTIAPLMAAIKAGNVATIQAHLSPGMSARYQTLLTRNSTYAAYLRSHYEDSGYLLRDVVASDAGYMAVIEVYWADGRREVFEFDLGDANPYLPVPGTLSGCTPE